MGQLERKYSSVVYQKLKELRPVIEKFVKTSLETGYNPGQETWNAILPTRDWAINLQGLILACYKGIELTRYLVKNNLRGLKKSIRPEIGIDFTLPPDEYIFIDMMRQRSAYLAQLLNETTYGWTAEFIERAYREGKTFDEISGELSNQLGLSRVRAKRIARTEVNWAINNGILKYGEELGFKEYQISTATNACDICMAAAKRTYATSGESPLPLHPNDRCVLVPVVPDSWLEKSITEDDLVQKAVSLIPVPKDGKNGERGERGEKGDRGSDGISPKIDYEKVTKSVLERIEIPRPKDGLDGKTPVVGQDYYTDEEKRSFTNEISDKVLDTVLKDLGKIDRGISKVETKKLIQEALEKLEVIAPLTRWGEIKGNVADQKDLVSYISGDYVLKSGDTMTGNLTLPTLKFDVLYSPTGIEPVGSLYWNEVDGTVNIALKNSSFLEIGQRMDFYGKALGSINNGDPVQFAGVQGDHIKIKKAVASELAVHPEYFIGIATQNIADGTYGYVTWFGKVSDIYTKTPTNNDTTDWLAGDILWINMSTGYLTKTEPVEPNRRIEVAAVIKEQTGSSETGIIIVRPNIGKKLADLDDVDGSEPTSTGDLLTYNSTTGTWERGAYNVTDYVLKSGDTLTGDLNFNGYKAIAMACDNGTVFPTSPSKGQWFLHTPTGRSWLYQWDGAAWKPIFAFGTSTIFFDPSGADTQDKGFGSGTDAYATPNYAYSQIPAIFSGAITIYGGAGTYDQTVALGGKTATGAFAINFIGTTTVLDSGTMTSSVQGTGATRGSVTDTAKAWTVDQFKGKFVKVGTTYRVIFSNDATTLTIQGTFPTLPSGAYSIEEIATNISRASGSAITFLTGTYNHNFTLCKVSSAGASSLVISGSLGQMSFTNCHLSADGVGTTLYQGSYFIPAISYCYLSVTNTSAYVCNAIANCAFTFYGNYVRSTSGTKANNGMVFGAGCYLVAAIGNTWDNFSNGVQLTGVGSATFATAASNGYNFFINNANGINVITAAAISSVTNNQYSGNTTNIAHAWTPGETVFSALRNTVATVIARQAAGGTVALIQAQNSSSQVLAQIDTNGGAVFNEQGSASADFRVEGDTLANLFFVDASADSIGVNTATPSSGLDIQRSMGWKVNIISTNTTLDLTHNVVLVSGNTIITLPTAVGNNRVYTIKKTDLSNTVTISTTSSQTIDGQASVQIVSQYTSLTLVSNGTNWLII